MSTNNSSYKRTLVTNIAALQASGTPANLPIGGIGIFDGTSYAATLNPTYLKNKSIIIAQGMPKLPFTDYRYAKMAGLPGGRSEKTHPISGALITNWLGSRGKPGQHEIVTIGYDGVDSAKTIFANAGDVKYLYIKATGLPISKLFALNGKVWRYSIQDIVAACCGEGCDPCAPASIEKMTDYLIDRVNNDITNYGLFRAFKKKFCTTPGTLPTTVGYTKWTLTINDAGDSGALGRVQAQAPAGTEVVLISRDDANSLSVYQFTQPTASADPTAFTTSTTTLIPDCPTCPSGYTSNAVTNLFEIEVPDGATVTGAQITGYVGKQLASQHNGRQTYTVSVATTQTVASVIAQAEAITAWEAIYLRQSQFSCTLTSPTTIPWANAGTGTKQQVNFIMTLKDSDCGTNRLAELVAAFASYGVVTLVSGAPSGACVHRYSIPVLSQYLDDTCVEDGPVFIAPPAHDGAIWIQEVIAPTASGCSFGIWFEGAFVARNTNECTYGIYPYEADGVHLQLSNYDPDYNAAPNEAYWPVTRLQAFALPQHFGAQIKPKEEYSKNYTGREFSMDPAVREAEGYKLFSDVNQYYDKYQLWYEYRFGVGGFAHTEVERHILDVYYPVAQGKSYENGINSYISSNPALGLNTVSL
jgi:hypothetical protein